MGRSNIAGRIGTQNLIFVVIQLSRLPNSEISEVLKSANNAAILKIFINYPRQYKVEKRCHGTLLLTLTFFSYSPVKW